ncbi:cysteine proteinase [Xylaria arbuscula]|nr:cysteine proteinase [Xylaria arbuscula]
MEVHLILGVHLIVTPPSSHPLFLWIKRERKLDPSNGIRHIWSQVVARRFGKLLTIVPSSHRDTATPRSCGNRLLSEGYERAVIECRSRVRKLVHESRMRGTKFLDREWNLDLDLATEDRHCLDGLAATCTLLDGGTATPKGVKRPSEIFESPSFLRKVDFREVEQGRFDNYWLMAALASLTNVENGIHRICVDFDTDLGIYGFIFQQDGEWVSTIIDDQLYLDFSSWPGSGILCDVSCGRAADNGDQNNKKGYWPGSQALLFSRCRDPNEIWLPLLEKAYAKINGDYAALSGGHTREALEDLTGGIATELVTREILDTENEFLFTCTSDFQGKSHAKSGDVLLGCTFVIMDASTQEDGQQFVLLSNPWKRSRSAFDIIDPASALSGRWVAGKRNNGNLPNKGSTFWVTYEELLYNFKYITRTRLFRDPNWYCSQVWSGIEVPWCHERFQVRLEWDSPIIMVLSQLDTRSFRGLEGQYTFRLYFSLYAQNDLGEQEYTICSNESVKMNRSVSIELSSLAAGTYAIFVKVSGKRNLQMLTEEEVIERGTKDRVENKKLGRVGQAYNLAHLKAAKHMNLVRKARITASCKSASESRKRMRGQMWERRHIDRRVTKLQTQKNTRKRNHLKARRAAERQRKAELNAAHPHEVR